MLRITCQMLIISDPFLTGDADLTFVECMLLHSEAQTAHMVQTCALRGHPNCLKESFKLDVGSYKQRRGAAGIFLTICLPVAYLFQGAPTLDCYRASQNTVTVVRVNSFKATACQRVSKCSLGANHTMAG